MAAKRKSFSIWGMIIISMIIFSGVSERPAVDKKESVRVFVQNFYDWYPVSDASRLKSGTPQSVTLEKRKDDFDSALRKALLDNDQASANNAHEIFGLDFDPFTNRHGTRKGFQTGNVKQAGNYYFVDVHDIERRRPQKAILASEIAVIVQVTDVGGRWKFANFIYPQSERNDNLLHILEILRKERTKQNK